MSNNYDIRCGMLMKIELNKNHIEDLMSQSYHYEFDEEHNYNNASKEKINAFWLELNERCVKYFENPEMGGIYNDAYNNLLEHIKDEIDELAYEFNFDFYKEYKIYRMNKDGKLEYERSDCKWLILEDDDIIEKNGIYIYKDIEEPTKKIIKIKVKKSNKYKKKSNKKF